MRLHTWILMIPAPEGTDVRLVQAVGMDVLDADYVARTSSVRCRWCGATPTVEPLQDEGPCLQIPPQLIEQS